MGHSMIGERSCHVMPACPLVWVCDAKKCSPNQGEESLDILLVYGTLPPTQELDGRLWNCSSRGSGGCLKEVVAVAIKSGAVSTSWG